MHRGTGRAQRFFRERGVNTCTVGKIYCIVGENAIGNRAAAFAQAPAVVCGNRPAKESFRPLVSPGAALHETPADRGYRSMQQIPSRICPGCV